MTTVSPEEMAKYGCFVHPMKDFELKRLEDACPECRRPYGFPLADAPGAVTLGGVEYEVSKALGRGFYGATYLASWGALAQRVVLKVIPVAVYEFHGKDFETECVVHNEVASDTEYLVGIETFGTADVKFGDLQIECHVAVLRYVDGVTLNRFLGSEDVTATKLAQLSIDLFGLLQELQNKGRYHNDLHERNLLVQNLGADRRRVNALHDSVRLVAVDLGSIADASKSGPGRLALGDLASVAGHVLGFASALLGRPDDVSDLDYRVACVLDEIGRASVGQAASLRLPEYQEWIQQIRDAHRRIVSPWLPPPGLSRFDDSYNAQTLHSFFVPRLLVDPDGEWVNGITVRGPQIITGMRGCGKTMLLRSIEFHSRIAHHELEASTSEAVDETDLASRITADGYVGLYVSARRLLDRLGRSDGELHEPYARLFLAYARQSVRAARHLSEVVPGALAPRWWVQISGAIEGALGLQGSLADSASDVVLERRLQRMMVSLDRGESEFTLAVNPAVAFSALAEELSSTSPVWQTASVFFLLDDVSTRHLSQTGIIEVLGTLMFSTEQSAFKLTSESQTLELALRSSGLIERLQPGRDYEPFDLAARVNEKLKNAVGGKEFIERILEQRKKAFANHPSASPRQLLGDASLESIASRIVATDRTARERRSVYHGIGAFAALCVGDIGDVLSIYETMIRKSSGHPIPDHIQTEAFLEHCSRRLYHLSRRGGRLKDAAISFAEAAHDLMVRSASGKRDRLRQYAQLYVRITSGDESLQLERLLELIDSGVFVLEGGSDAPRAKTRDADPIAQFTLTYRKLFGLSNYMGLAFGDRFELSGDDLEAWLHDPARGKEILMRNLGGELTAAQEAEARAYAAHRLDERSGQQQLSLYEATPVESSPEVTLGEPVGVADLPWLPTVRAADIQELERLGVETVVLGLGFEERTLESARQLLGATKPKLAILVRYAIEGHASAIRELAKMHASEVVEIAFEDVSAEGLPFGAGLTLVDVTGLAKSFLFLAVRQAFRQSGRVLVGHTAALKYYPLDPDIEAVLSASDSADPTTVLEAASGIWSGDLDDYDFDALLPSESDDSRGRILCAAASPKHERLLSLLDARPYDRVDVFVPVSDSPRSQLARLAATVAMRGQDEHPFDAAVDSDDVDAMLVLLGSRFETFYRQVGYNIEFALTGSKMHAVACSIMSALRKIAQCWYVRPSSWDESRFTSGVGDTRLYLIERKDSSPLADELG